MMEALQTLAFVVVGIFISFVEERWGKFQDMQPGTKQIVNGALALVLPGVVAWMAGWWNPEFGDANVVVTQLVYLLVPAGVWAVTQLAHLVDRAGQYLGDWLKSLT